MLVLVLLLVIELEIGDQRIEGKGRRTRSSPRRVRPNGGQGARSREQRTVDGDDESWQAIARRIGDGSR